MRVLWIVNTLLPEAESLLLNKNTVSNSSGGWIESLSLLVAEKGIDLFVACVSKLTIELEKLKGERITYFVIPYGKGNLSVNNSYDEYWTRIHNDVRPEIVHIHGTEFSHGLAYMKLFPNDRIAISVQGLKSVIGKYYLAGLSFSDILYNITLRDILKRDTLWDSKKSFLRQGEYEKEMIKRCRYIIGRTTWDRDHVLSINREAKYFVCNETLRKDFYRSESWCYKRCIKHSIFLSQASYPIKGLHQLLYALPSVLNEYPDTTVRIAGYDITKRGETGFKRYLLSGYGCFIKNILKKYNLSNEISFLGYLDTRMMINEYLRCNVFICPSAIENSPNSLGEAQILGTPVIASYAGGIPDMMKGNEENMYRFEEPELLTRNICNIFSLEDRQHDMREIAMLRHNEQHIVANLTTIYKTIICES